MHLTNVWTKLTHRNMSNEERFVRVLVGGTLIMLAVVLPFVWAWGGLYPLVTGIFGSSPIYRMLGIQRHHTLGA